MPRKNSVGDGGSAAQKRALGALPDAVRATKKSSKQVASGTTAEKGAADKGSMQWIPKQIVAIGEDFHSQVGDGKVRTTLYKVR